MLRKAFATLLAGPWLGCGGRAPAKTPRWCGFDSSGAATVPVASVTTITAQLASGVATPTARTGGRGAEGCTCRHSPTLGSAHLDQVHPECDLLGHLRRDAPTAFVALVTGATLAFIAAATRCRSARPAWTR